MGIGDCCISSTHRHCHLTTDADAAPPPLSQPMSSPSVAQTLLLLQSDDQHLRVHAAKEIRRLTKTSKQYRFHFSSAIGPLVDMLSCQSDEANGAALAALLNLAVKDERNKVNIIDAGALRPIIGFLQCENLALQDHATAALITLSASSVNKPIIVASGATPHLVNILRNGNTQAKSDAVMTLYNLSTHPDNLTTLLEAKPIPPLVHLLQSCKISSKTAEKCIALLETLVSSEEGMTVLTSEEGGILAIVEILESGSLRSREYAIGILLAMCQSDRAKYRELILREGVIPGLLKLTIQGTIKSQSNARMLLQLLRDSPYQSSEFQPDTLEKIVCNIVVSEMEKEEQNVKAKRMLAEMVQVSMEQSLRHLQQRVIIFAPNYESKP